MLALHQAPPRRRLIVQHLVVGAALQVAEDLRNPQVPCYCRLEQQNIHNVGTIGLLGIPAAAGWQSSRQAAAPAHCAGV